MKINVVDEINRLKNDEAEMKSIEQEYYGLDNTTQHFIDRILERYGLTITKENYLYLCDRDMSIIKKDKNIRRVVLVYRSKMIYAVYCSTRRKLLTALPTFALHKDLKDYHKRLK